MAISAPHFAILKHCKAQGILPQKCRILEIGEANYYGDFNPQEIFDLAGEECDPRDTYAVAKLIYKVFFEVGTLAAIDAGGPTAYKLDLNFAYKDWGDALQPIPNLWEVVYNHGTAEHIFNIAQVFGTMHDFCRTGGIMIHECPFTGWLDHGFYNLQPTLFWDLARANNYKVELFAIESITPPGMMLLNCREDLFQVMQDEKLPKSLMLFVILRKQENEPFKIPTQGVYSGRVSQEVTEAWSTLR